MGSGKLTTLLIALIVTFPAVAQDRIWVTQDSGGQLVFQRVTTGADGIITGTPVTDITFVDLTGLGTPDGPPPDPQPPIGDLQELREDVSQIAAAINQPETAEALSRMLETIAGRVRNNPDADIGKTGEAVREAIDLVVGYTRGDAKQWQAAKARIQAAMDLQAQLGKLNTAKQWADLVDAVADGIGDSVTTAQEEELDIDEIIRIIELLLPLILRILGL